MAFATAAAAKAMPGLSSRSRSRSRPMPLVPPPLPPPVEPPPPAKDARGVGSCEQSYINRAEFLARNLNYCLDGKTHLIIRRADGNSFVYPLSHPLVPIKETDKLELAWGPLTPESRHAAALQRPAAIAQARSCTAAGVMRHCLAAIGSGVCCLRCEAYSFCYPVLAGLLSGECRGRPADAATRQRPGVYAECWGGGIR